MTKLKDIAKLIRSKNAKSFLLTIDIMFEDEKTYQKVKKSGIINKQLISQLYNTPIENILFTECDEGYAFKATIPRPIVQGDLGDGDIYGGQLHGPLLEVDIPGL